MLFDTDVPFALRRLAADHEHEFPLIGEAHVQGIVDTEVMRKLERARLSNVLHPISE